MKKLFTLLLLTFSGLTFGDGNNDWQKIDENIIKLNSLNSCQGCLLRNTNFVGADLIMRRFQALTLYRQTFQIQPL